MIFSEFNQLKLNKDHDNNNITNNSRKNHNLKLQNTIQLIPNTLASHLNKGKWPILIKEIFQPNNSYNNNKVNLSNHNHNHINNVKLIFNLLILNQKGYNNKYNISNNHSNSKNKLIQCIVSILEKLSNNERWLICRNKIDFMLNKSKESMNKENDHRI